MYLLILKTSKLNYDSTYLEIYSSHLIGSFPMSENKDTLDKMKIEQIRNSKERRKKQKQVYIILKG